MRSRMKRGMSSSGGVAGGNQNKGIGKSNSPTTKPTTPTTPTTTPTTTTTTTTVPPTTTALQTTETSSLGTILILLVLGGICVSFIVGAYFGYKYYNKNKKSVPSKNQPKGGQKKRDGTKKKGKSKQKKGSDDEDDEPSQIEYPEKKHFSGVIINM